MTASESFNCYMVLISEAEQGAVSSDIQSLNLDPIHPLLEEEAEEDDMELIQTIGLGEPVKDRHRGRKHHSSSSQPSPP